MTMSTVILDPPAVEAQIMMAHTAVVWDRESENSKRLSDPQKEFAKSFRNEIIYQLRQKLNCSKILESHWRIRDLSMKPQVAQKVNEWNDEMKRNGLNSLMFVVDVWGQQSEIQTWQDLEMSALIGWLAEMQENLTKAIDHKYFHRSSAHKYEKHIAFFRDVLENDFPSHARKDEALRDLQAVEELFHEATKWVVKKGGNNVV